MASPKPTARTSPLVWVLLLLLVALVGFVGYQKWGRRPATATPVSAPEAAPASGSDSTASPVTTPAPEPSHRGHNVMVG